MGIRWMGVRLLLGTVLCAALALSGFNAAHAAGGGSFTYSPHQGTLTQEISVSASCSNPSGAAVGLFHVGDGAEMDHLTGLLGAHWQVWLEPNSTMLTSSGTRVPAPRPGNYEIRLFCGIGSAYRSPNQAGGTPRAQADSIQPYAFTNPPPQRLPSTDSIVGSVTYLPASGAVGSKINVRTVCNYSSPTSVVGLFRKADGAQIDVQKGATTRQWNATLTVNAKMLTPSGQMVATSGPAELRLFCDPNPSYKAPNDPAATKRDFAQATAPFAIVAAVFPRVGGAVAPRTSAAALPAKDTSSSFPLPVAGGVAAAAIAALAAAFFARRPLLALIGVTEPTKAATNGHRVSRKDDGKHPICLAAWSTSSGLTTTARSATSERLGRELKDAASKWSTLQAKIDAASDAFAPLRGEEADEDDASADELELAHRILDGVPGALERKR